MQLRGHDLYLLVSAVAEQVVCPVCCRTPHCLDLDAAKTELQQLESDQDKATKLELAAAAAAFSDAAAAAPATGRGDLSQLQARLEQLDLAVTATGLRSTARTGSGAQHAGCHA